MGCCPPCHTLTDISLRFAVDPAKVFIRENRLGEGAEIAPRKKVALGSRVPGTFGLQPHHSRTFKLSSDPLFVDKVRDIVGLYLSPPNRALVLSIDEKARFRHSIASNQFGR